MTQIIILAAGRGTRMAADVPKVLVLLNGRAMIERLMDGVVESQVDPSPIVVVSDDNKDIISEALNKYNVQYVIQDKQLGTGHAVNSARELISPQTDKILVLYGDHPFISGDSIARIVESSQGVVTVVPTKVEDYNDWRHNFYHWGRFIRNKEGKIIKIVEFKDASEKEKNILEVNPGFMCFNGHWLFNTIDQLSNDNKAQEYYLTDMINIAFNQREEIGTVYINPKEAIGINSKEELEEAKKLL